MSFLKSFLLTVLLIFSGATYSMQPSFETISLGGNFSVGNSETKTLWLSNTRFIKNITVQAEGIYSDSMVEVMVNGEIKGTIYAPGRDPSYIVTIGESASSIQFRYRSGGNMRIRDVQAVVSTWSGKAPRRDHGGSSRSNEDGQDLANRALMAVETIGHYSTLEEEKMYFMPIKKKAAQVIIMSGARGTFSRKTIEALIALENQIDFSKGYLEVMMEQDGLFDAAVELLSIRESINDLVD